MAAPTRREASGLFHGRLVKLRPLTNGGVCSSFDPGDPGRLPKRNAIYPDGFKENVFLRREELRRQAMIEMKAILSMMPSCYPVTQEMVQADHYQAALGDEQDMRRMNRALRLYQGGNEGSDHVLMSIAAAGYKTLHQFLLNIDPEKYQHENEVDQFCDAFCDERRLSHCDGLDVANRIETVLQDATNVLVDFYKNLPALPSMVTVKALRSVSSGGEVTGLFPAPNEYVKAVLRGEVIRHSGFLSTTKEIAEAKEFNADHLDDVFSNMLSVISLDSADDANEVVRRELLALFESAYTPEKNVFLFIRGDGAAGLDAEALSRAYVDNRLPGKKEFSEAEILFSPGHVFMPSHLIFGEEAVVVFGHLNRPESMSIGNPRFGPREALGDMAGAA